MFFKIYVTFVNCYAVDDFECPSPDWIENNGFCYQRFLASLTWPEANQACQNLDANLVSIHSQAEQDFMDCKFTFFLFYTSKTIDASRPTDNCVLNCQFPV